FLWQHIDDLVGKGLSIDVLGELFFYAALSMVPLALPLAILLASLMTFGNLGESFELTAMKAGGISLFRVMRPLIWLMVVISIGAFFFQNNALPLAQARMWTLLRSMRQKSPELDIKEGEFNYQLPNVNIFVSEKNHDTGMLYDVTIYDMRQGFDRSRVIKADSASLAMSEDKMHLYLTMYSGLLSENLRDATGVNTSARNQLYRTEAFHRKQLMMEFNTNFNRMDEGDMRSLYIGKNVSQLSHSIDSLNQRVDSIGSDIGHALMQDRVLGINRYTEIVEPDGSSRMERSPESLSARTVDIDSIFTSPDFQARRRFFTIAQADVQQKRMENLGRSLYMDDESRIMRRHSIELLKKFTLSLACIVFFFIGAPLGAIIRKGGMGMPLVISVLLFIVYYIIDNTGVKMARDGKVAVWEGVWLSSAILLPLGFFVTWKAVNDSSVFNADAYKNFMRALLNKDTRSLSRKEVVIEEVETPRALEMTAELLGICRDFRATYTKPQGYGAYWNGGFNETRIKQLTASLEITVSYLANSRSLKVIGLLNNLPLLHDFAILHPTTSRLWSRVWFWAIPAGVPMWLIGRRWQRRFLRKIDIIITETSKIETILNSDEQR
ncbi:MAG: LptF/LptG family permease, partial [Muribaculaceae bacterium]|nr:LptF/LptG family permease [Muribaculaceae bacterium]